MTRIPFPDLADAPQEVRSTFEAIPFDLAIIRMMAHASGAFAAWLQFGAAVLGQSSLGRDIQELVICVVTLAESPNYEYAHHRPALIAAGFSEEQAAAIENGDWRSPALPAREQAAAMFAQETYAHVRASDETLTELRLHFTDRQVIELVICVGFYMLNNRVAENAGVTVEDDLVFAKPGQFVPKRPVLASSAPG